MSTPADGQDVEQKEAVEAALAEAQPDAQTGTSPPLAPHPALPAPEVDAPADKPEVEAAEETEERGDKSGEEGGGGGWWSGWYESAVSKSSQAMDFMRKDLTELSSAVQSESASLINSSVLSSGMSAVSSTASFLKDAVSSLVQEEEEPEHDPSQGKPDEGKGNEERVAEESEPLSPEELEKRMREREAAFEQEVRQILQMPESLAIAAGSKISSYFNSLVEVLAPVGYGAEGEEDGDDVVLLPDQQTMSRDRWDVLLRAVQADPRTYCHEPDGTPEDYESWLERFNLMDVDVQRILQTSPDVRDFHSRLVPDQLTFDMFWQRYFYRIENLKQCEARRARMLKERAAAAAARQTEHGQAAEDKSPTPPGSGGRQEVPITSLKEAKSGGESATTTPTEGKRTAGGGGSSGATSDEWEKTSLTDIVDEAAAKLAHKLNTLPDTRSDEELNEWEFE